MAHRSATRSGTFAIGVAVTTSSPNPDRSSSSGTATHPLSAASSGADTSQPMTPPDSRTPGMSFAGDGTPAAMCRMPSTPTPSAVMPMTTRPVSSCCSGWRSVRHASSASSTGSAIAMMPRPPRTTFSSAIVTTPSGRNQVTEASTMDEPSSARPRPSRRCSGSRLRAPFP